MIREWGSWLRAPARRGGNLERSKWLRDERDGGWGAKSGDEENQGFQNSNLQQDRNVMHKSREELNKFPGIEEISNQGGNLNKSKEGITVSNNNGLDDAELDGLELEERKRKRIGPLEKMDCERVGKDSQLDSMLSDSDCTETSNSFLAQLAMQASRGQ